MTISVENDHTAANQAASVQALPALALLGNKTTIVTAYANAGTYTGVVEANSREAAARSRADNLREKLRSLKVGGS